MKLSIKLFLYVIFALAYPCYSDWTQGPTLPNLADSNGWNDPEYYSTFQVNTLYDLVWLFARGQDGVEVYTYNHTTEAWNVLPILPDLADSNNWGSDPKYYSTMQVVTLGNDFWLLARGEDGLVLYQYDPLPSTWTQRQGNSRFSDVNQWDQSEYYSTMEAFGGSGKIWLFVRGPSGEEIHVYDPDTDSWDALPVLSALSDANRWGSNERYYSTIQVVPFENSYWLIARGAQGIELYQYDPATDRWSERQGIPDFSDQTWGEVEYYSTIQSVALQDSIWLFGRGEYGVVVYQYDPDDNTWTQKQSLPALSDSNGWDQQQYYSTIQVVTLEDSIALLARGPNGLQYYEYFPNTDSWSSHETLTNLSDANNWDSPEYYSTIKAINYDDDITVLARGDSGVEIYDNND